MDIFTAYHVFTNVFCEYYDNREKGIYKCMYRDFNVALCHFRENGNLISAFLTFLCHSRSTDCGNDRGRLKRRKGIGDGEGFVILGVLRL
jgi:hypothetical protein